MENQMSEILELPDAVSIGTRMSTVEIEAYLGVMPNEHNKELSDLLRDVCVLRGYFSKTVSRKIRFYRVVVAGQDFQSLTDSRFVMLGALKTGAQWCPDVAAAYADVEDALATVNSKYPYGRMDKEVRQRYVLDLDRALGSRLKRLPLLD
jgi:hypothetical protein